MLGGVLVALCGTNADAQSRKERRQARKRAEELKELRQSQQAAQMKKPVTTPVKKEPPKPPSLYPSSVVKDRYRIDVLAPLYLSELVQDGKVVEKGLPDKVIPSLKFYEGMVLATDTLKKLGYKFDIYVYDVADELESPATLVNTDAFKGSDLIMGILSSKDFPLVASYVKRNNINFISALSPSNNSVSNNPYFTMLQPSLETHCEAIEAAIYRKNGNITPLLFYRTSVPVDNIALNNFITNNAIEFKKVACDEIPSKDDIQPLLNKTGKNVILMPILNDKYVDGILVRLAISP